MKNSIKRIVYPLVTLALAVGLFTLSCKSDRGSASVAFADNGNTISSADSYQTTLALQDTFRTITREVLPSVVEVDVTETHTVQTFNPFRDIPFFNFNWGNGDDDDNGGSTREYQQSGLGSGIIVRKTGNTVYVLTNNHVAGSATTITIRLNDEREFEGTLVGADDRMDIALVSFESNDDSIKVATLGDSDQVQQGDIVMALGSPLGYFASVTQGIVSATGRSGSGIGNINDFIQTDAAINQGNSGGPLVNIRGEVIGINTWIASQSGGSQGLGFSIPINNIKQAIDQFIESGHVTYGWIGVSLLEITDDYKDALGIPDGQTGAFASQVFLNGPAYEGGVMPGDYIIRLNGQDVTSVDQLVRDIGAIAVGDEARLTVLRGDRTLNLTVRIDERDEDVSANDANLWPGFVASPLTDDLRDELNIDNNRVQGVVVAQVYEQSPASALRLQQGDVICAVNDQSVSNLQEFYEALDTTDKREIYFDVYNDGHVITTSRYRLGR